MQVAPSGRETIWLRNTADAPVDLEGYAITAGGHDYAFEHETVLAGGALVRLRVGGSPADDTPLHQSWGRTTPLLDDDGARRT